MKHGQLGAKAAAKLKNEIFNTEDGLLSAKNDMEFEMKGGEMGGRV